MHTNGNVPEAAISSIQQKLKMQRSPSNGNDARYLFKKLNSKRKERCDTSS